MEQLPNRDLKRCRAKGETQPRRTPLTREPTANDQFDEWRGLSRPHRAKQGRGVELYQTTFRASICFFAAVKVRGRESLRIICGPEYTLPENLERLKSRGLGTKRSLALREFALGLEALERFIHKEPLRRVHECVFGVLALESEPVDPRL